MISKQPKKQRKMTYKAPLHRRHRLITATMSSELREEYKKRSVGLKKGDLVKVMRGDFKGHEGKIEKVVLKSSRVYIEGATVKKADGTERFYPFHTSKVKIIKLDLKDEKRKKILER